MPPAATTGTGATASTTAGTSTSPHETGVAETGRQHGDPLLERHVGPRAHLVGEALRLVPGHPHGREGDVDAERAVGPVAYLADPARSSSVVRCPAAIIPRPPASETVAASAARAT